MAVQEGRYLQFLVKESDDFFQRLKGRDREGKEGKIETYSGMAAQVAEIVKKILGLLPVGTDWYETGAGAKIIKNNSGAFSALIKALENHFWLK